MTTTRPDAFALREWTTSRVECGVAIVRVLQSHFHARVSPVALDGNSPEIWDITPGSVVGALAVDGRTIVVRPRIPVRNVLFLVSLGLDDVEWRTNDLDLLATEDVHLALAQLFIIVVERTLAQGVLHGYRSVETDLMTLRGRVDIAEQMRRRPGRDVPLATLYQEHDKDVPENRIIKAAALALRGLCIASPDLRHRLHRIAATLVDVSHVSLAVAHPSIAWTRLNERYRGAVELGVLVLDGTGIDVFAGATTAQALTLYMPDVSERFLTRTLGHALEAQAGKVVAEDSRWSLDEERRVVLYPIGNQARSPPSTATPSRRAPNSSGGREVTPSATTRGGSASVLLGNLP